MNGIKSETNIKKKIVIVGDGNSGKTALLMVFGGKPFPGKYVPTLFENYTTQLKVGNKVVDLSLWDTAGQEDYDRLRPLSYPDSDVVIITFAVCNVFSFGKIKEKWLPETKHFLPNTPSLLVGMKTDLRDDPSLFNDPSLQEELKTNNNSVPITYEQGVQMAEEIGAAAYMETSARTGKGVNEVFDVAAKLSLNIYQKKRIQKCKML